MMKNKVMEKDYLTVKEYATLKGCSTQYVYKLLQTKLNDFVVVVNGKKCLKISVLDEGFESVATKVANQVDNQVANKIDNSSASEIEIELKRINDRNEHIIDELREQIKEKDLQLKQMNEKIVSLFETNQRLLENNQSLQLNYQMLLGNTSNQINDTIVEEEDKQGAQAQNETIIETEIKENKKGFWKRLFNI